MKLLIVQLTNHLIFVILKRPSVTTVTHESVKVTQSCWYICRVEKEKYMWVTYL